MLAYSRAAVSYQLAGWGTGKSEERLPVISNTCAAFFLRGCWILSWSFGSISSALWKYDPCHTQTINYYSYQSSPCIFLSCICQKSPTQQPKEFTLTWYFFWMSNIVKLNHQTIDLSMDSIPEDSTVLRSVLSTVIPRTLYLYISFWAFIFLQYFVSY